jgi:hypothetical protein
VRARILAPGEELLSLIWYQEPLSGDTDGLPEVPHEMSKWR